jgi:arylsulfatase A-like enzyme
MQGRSFVPLTRGEREGWPAEVFVQISESQVGRAIRTDRWKYSVSAPGRDAWEESSSDHYVEEFLYDLEADPYELTNLAGLEAFRELSAELRERLIGRMVAAGEAAPLIEPAVPQPGRERSLNPGDYWKRVDASRKSPHLP